MMKKMLKLILCLIVLISVTKNQQVNDVVECFRLQDSVYGHYVNCSCNKPLPLKIQTTFQLDQDFAWNPYLSYAVYIIDGSAQNSTYIGANCFKGVPSQGNKSRGSNLTLSMQCNSLPRELKNYDMIAVHILFPDMKWLTYAIPIPGYSSSKDVLEMIKNKQNILNSLNKQVKEKFLKESLLRQQSESHKIPNFIKNLHSIRTN